MTIRDYTKEVGVHSAKKTVPRFVAAIIFGLVAVGIFFGVAGILAHAKEAHRAEKRLREPVPAASPAAPGEAAPTVPPPTK